LGKIKKNIKRSKTQKIKKKMKNKERKEMNSFEDPQAHGEAPQLENSA
jgi:hypothetical protein